MGIAASGSVRMPSGEFTLPNGGIKPPLLQTEARTAPIRRDHATACQIGATGTKFSCSRLLVTVSASRRQTQFLAAFSQNALLLLLSASDSCQFTRKMREICSTQKSDILCVQVLLSFVPTLFVFLHDPPGSPQSGSTEPRRIAAFLAHDGPCMMPESSNSAFIARI